MLQNFWYEKVALYGKLENNCIIKKIKDMGNVLLILCVSKLFRSKVDKMTDIVTGNPLVVKMIVAYNR